MIFLKNEHFKMQLTQKDPGLLLRLQMEDLKSRA